MSLKDVEQKVLSKIAEMEVVKLAQEAARTFSPNGQEAELAHLFSDRLKALGFEVEFLEVTKGRPNVIARLRGTGDGYSLLFNGHLDGNRRVPLPGWTKDPRGGELSHGRVYGEGLRDMKGGDVAMLMAANAVKDARVPLKGDVIFTATIGHGEHGLGVEQLVDKKISADMAIIAEPTNMNVCITHRAWVDMELITEGLPTAYHTIQADKGVNAIEKMSKIILAMKNISWRRPKVPDEVDRLYPDQACYWNIGMIDGHFSGGGSPSLVPDYCKAALNLRPMYGMGYDEMVAEVANAIEQVKASDKKVRATLRMAPGFPLDYLYIPSDSPLVKAGIESIRQVTGSEPSLVKYDWTTDGGILQRRSNIPTVVWGPCEALYTPLGPDENITVEELLGATKSFALAATKICSRTKDEFDKTYRLDS